MRRFVATFLAPIAALAGGCDWRVFDDLADTTWVSTHEAPDDVGPADYGLALSPGGPASSGARYFVAMRNPDGVARAVVGADGAVAVTGSAVRDHVTDAAPLPDRPAMAVDPDAASFLLAVPKGDPSAPTASDLLVYDAASFAVTRTVPIAAHVTALAIGATDATAGSGNDAVLAAGNQLVVVAAYATDATTSACTLDREAAYAVVLGDFGGGAQIAVAAGNANLSGAGAEVQILTGATVVAGADDACSSTDAVPPRAPLLTLAAPGGEADFGASMVAGDFDGDGRLDLAVAAPSANRVYVYLELDAGAADTGTRVDLVGPSGSARFGAALAAGDFDGDGAAELVVGDPQTGRAGPDSAGAAHIYAFDGATPGTPLTLHDAQPDPNQRFGRALAIADFAGEDLLIVGAHREVFTYLRTPVPGDADVR